MVPDCDCEGSGLEDPVVRAWARDGSSTYNVDHQIDKADLLSNRAANLQKLITLIAEIRHLRQEIAKTDVIISPIRRLPFEILSKNLGLVDTFSFPQGARKLLNLLLVCRSWRHCIYETPLFWCDIRSSESPLDQQATS